MNTILENNIDIILVQEPPKSLIRCVPSHTDPTGDPIYGTPNHPNWTLFIRQDPAQENYAQVATYVNKKLQKMRFTLRLDRINHQDVNILAFHSGQHTSYVINVYSDNNQSTLHFLNQNIVNLNNTVVMTGNFNIRYNCHKLHLVISPPNLRRFLQSQNQLKALKKTFRSMPVTS